jgi:hypothetical protein
MDAVESYRLTVSDSALYDARGNKALERRFDPHSVNEKSLPVKKLPRNWYDRAFYQGLHQHEKRKLNCTSKVNLPFLVRCSELLFHDYLGTRADVHLSLVSKELAALCRC